MSDTPYHPKKSPSEVNWGNTDPSSITNGEQSFELENPWLLSPWQCLAYKVVEEKLLTIKYLIDDNELRSF